MILSCIIFWMKIKLNSELGIKKMFFCGRDFQTIIRMDDYVL